MQNNCHCYIVLFVAIFLKNNSRLKTIVGKQETQNWTVILSNTKAIFLW
jgi:hypothetical protein